VVLVETDGVRVASSVRSPQVSNFSVNRNSFFALSKRSGNDTKHVTSQKYKPLTLHRDLIEYRTLSVICFGSISVSVLISKASHIEFLILQ